MQDYFDAVAYWDRLVLLEVKTDELLRQGTKRSHRGRQERLLAEAREQLSSQMRDRKRRPFRGEVAVELTIHAFGSGPIPQAPKSVKRYLDAMSGIVYSDDRQVAHLVVHRLADDWPGRSGASRKAVRGDAEQHRPTVTINVSPLRIFARDWERAFCGPQGWHDDWLMDDDSLRGESRRRLEDLSEGRWTANDDFRLNELRDEERQDRAGGWLDRLPPDLATLLRDMRRREMDRLRRKLLLDQLPGAYDHPLGKEPDFNAELARDLGIDAIEESRWNLPGSFWLPLGHRASDWADAVRLVMQEHRAGWRVLPDAFDNPLALDIAAVGLGSSGKDIDNLGHVVLAEFERLYCGDHRGTVVMYRIYRKPSSSPGVRVQVMTRERLSNVFELVEDARSSVIERGLRTD